jgi:iron complex outermembrane recepter protein
MWLLLATAPAMAQSPGDLADMSLEDLANIQITSVSKKSESLADAPASVFVISRDDIRRSGVLSLPEALRLAPNLQVARINARSYAITARGFNSISANKLLVMVDGRSLYAPLFSGVFWDAQDLMLEDVERIEVISGPGATLWGANAVNGVINVITRSARDTQGVLLTAGKSAIQQNGAARYGGMLANGGYYRAYAKYGDHDNTRLAGGGSSVDGWHRSQAGFRADWGNAVNGFSLHGDAYSGRLHQLGTEDVEIAGANLVGRRDRQLADGSSLRWQAYYDHTERKQPNRVNEQVDTLDLEFQHAIDLGKSHHVVWGAGHRVAHSRTGRSGGELAFLPETRTMHWTNLFVQDEMALRENLHLTAGLKIEHSTFTDVEHLPSLRLAWKPSAGHLMWASAARAIRAPSRIDSDLFLSGGAVTIAGGPEIKSEIANVLELGYRVQPSSALSYSITAFYSEYDRLRTLEPDPVPPRYVFKNMGEATVYGAETWGNWQVRPQWRLGAGLVAQKLERRLKPGSADISEPDLGSADPDHYWTLRSSHDLAHDKKLDLTVRRVGRLNRSVAPSVPAYTAVDLHFSWQLSPSLELSLTGQNLLDRAHVEYVNGANRSEIERSIFLKLLWRM